MTVANRILVVDDEMVIRTLLVDILTEEGFDVESAKDAREALSMLADPGEFVILFTDIMMPEMNGIELIREARKGYPDLIPIIMTGFATLETARAAVKEGAYDYVLKPFSLSEIKLAVTNAIERYSLSHENARLREITELFHISETLASIHEEQRLLDYVLSAALDRVDAERGSLMMTTPDGRSLCVAASVGLPVSETHAVVDVGTSISGWVAEHAEPLLVGNIYDNPDLAAMSHELGDRSFISVPLERKDPRDGLPQTVTVDVPRVIGVLNVNAKKGGGEFSEGDLKILSIVANHAAAALINVRLIEDLENTHLATLQSMSLVLEAKDAYTSGHSERVRDYSLLAARKMGMSDKDIEILRVGAVLHDVGKIGVSDAVLNKSGKLTSEEWEAIRRHPAVGYDVLRPVRTLAPEHLQLIRSHHERMDGQGYPDGLDGSEIPPLTRIIAVADAYDAMASHRAYRRALSTEEIVGQLTEHSSTQFDPDVARVFIDLIENGELA